MKCFGNKKSMPYMSEMSFHSDAGGSEDTYKRRYDEIPKGRFDEESWYSELLNTEKEYISIISNLDTAYEVLKNVVDQKAAEDLQHFALLEQREKSLNTYFRKSQEQIEKFFSGSSNGGRKMKKESKEKTERMENKEKKEKQQKFKKSFKKVNTPKQLPRKQQFPKQSIPKQLPRKPSTSKQLPSKQPTPKPSPPCVKRANAKHNPFRHPSKVRVKQMCTHLMHENTSDSDFARNCDFKDVCCTKSEFETMLNQNSFFNNSIDKGLFESLTDLSCRLSESECTCINSQTTYTGKDDCTENNLKFKMSDFSCFTRGNDTEFDRTMYFPSESIMGITATKKRSRPYINKSRDLRDKRDLNNYDLCELEVHPRYCFASDMYLSNC